MSVRIVSLFVLLLALDAAVAACADPIERRMIDGLLERRLFGLAESYCQQRLSGSDVSERRRAEITVELSRTYAEEALNAAPGDRDAHWQEALGVVQQFRAAAPNGPFRWLAQRQEALVSLSAGELARHEAEVVAEADTLLDEARRRIRAAVAELQRLDEQIDDELIRRSQRPVGGTDSLTTDELHLLQSDVRSQLARALMNQGLCYPAETADRTNSLSRAAAAFRPLAEAVEPIDWNSRLGLLRCLRHLKDTAMWQRLLRHYAEQAPTAIEAELKLERAKNLLDLGQTAEALKVLDDRPALTPLVAARWDYARLVALLAAWKAEQDSDRAAALQKQTIRQVELLEADHGPYWMRRAEGLMGRHVAAAPATDDLAILIRAAASFYRAGKLADALAAYDRARDHATASGQRQQAFELGKKAAAIEQQRGHFAEARDRFRAVANAQPDHADAAATHLLATYNAAQQLQAAKSPDLSDYIAILEEHLQRWPDSPTADNAAWWLGRVLMSQAKWSEAADSLGKIRLQYEDYPAVLVALAECYRRQLATLAGSQKDQLAVATAAADHFSRIADEAAGAADLKLVARAALVEAARFRLHFARQQYAETERALTAALAENADAPAEWKTAARSLLVYALAAQPEKLALARSQLDELAAALPHDLLDLVIGVAALMHDASPQSQRRLAELVLHAAKLLDEAGEKLAPAARQQLDRAVTEAYVAAGQRREALAAYKRLAETYPNDARIHTAYAELLLDGPDAASWQAALTKWREVETKSRPGTPNWFLAKYSQALAHERLGNKQQAARIVKVMQVLHPDLGGAELKARFLELLRRCEN